MNQQYHCGGCGSNKWQLTYEDNYPTVIIMTCTVCHYADTMYLEDAGDF
jgi:hypothetical protein